MRLARHTLPAVLALALLALLLAAPGAQGATAVPSLAGRVNDTAGMIPPPIRKRLEIPLRALEERTGAQVAVLTVNTLGGDSIEEYAVRVFETWKLGRRGVNDGVLLLVVRQERRMRIEVGYGLEDRLTDARSRQILDDFVRPHFGEGNFGAGVEAGIDAIAKTIEGAALPTPPRVQSVPISPFIWIFVLIIGGFSLVALFLPGCFGWFLYLFLAPFYVEFPTAIFPPYDGLIAAGSWLVLFPILRTLLDTPQFFELMASQDSGGRWRSSGGGFSGGGGSSGGGGGFSGGGGSSGGGGASGSW